MSVNAILYEREQEPEFFARKCRRCKQPETRCECEDDGCSCFGFVSCPYPTCEKRAASRSEESNP